LLLTSLRGVNGEVYAVAQGPVVTGGFIAGRGGSSQTLNHPTVGRTPNGATVEKTAPSIAPGTTVRLQLRQADFTTAARIVDVLNKRFATGNQGVAKAENSGLITVSLPAKFSGNPIGFVAEMEALTVTADLPARVVINERTGTIIIGKDVRVAPVAVMHGNLTVQIETSYAVSQPQPFSSGTTSVVPQVGVGVKEEKARNVVLKEGATVEELVRALMSIGSTPRDVIAILQSLKSAGALSADVEVV
jgi:flagellar P-ring protein precursor FlgI